jgi:glutamine amidotransferase-like uncharacterized protein
MRNLRRNFAVAFVLITTAFAVCAPQCVRSREIVHVLLFAGNGTSSNDVAAVRAILDDSRINYRLLNSSDLNDMTASQLSGYHLLIVPGANFVDMGNNLTARTTARVRNAVNGGLNYLGICAGGFLAGSFPTGYNSFDLTSGVQFGFYSAENNGTHKAAVRISTAQGPALDQYWEDGPQLTGWGNVVAKYPDGTPAVVEEAVGKGWVVLTGIHAEAPESWRRGMTFNTPVSTDTAYAQMLIVAALNGEALPHY